MKKLKTKEESKLYNKYHIPGCSSLTTIKLGAVFLRKGNTKDHEQLKFDLAWEALLCDDNYIIEAARKATDEEKKVFKVQKDKVIDFVNISQGQEYEIVNKHESDVQILFYRKNGVIPLIVGENIVCEKCKEKYPRRNKSSICQVCK